MPTPCARLAGQVAGQGTGRRPADPAGGAGMQEPAPAQPAGPLPGTPHASTERALSASRVVWVVTVQLGRLADDYDHSCEPVLAANWPPPPSTAPAPSTRSPRQAKDSPGCPALHSVTHRDGDRDLSGHSISPPGVLRCISRGNAPHRSPAVVAWVARAVAPMIDADARSA